MFTPRKLPIVNFLSNADLTKEDTLYILDLAKKFKNKELEIDIGKNVLGLIFEKASTRTRVSFQVAMSRIGGSTIDLNPTTSQLGRGESIKDTSRVLSRYCDILAIRTFRHSDLEEYARYSSKPIINALSDLEHPCQALADFMTIKEEFGDFKNLILTFIGDGNNVSNSLLLCGSLLGVEVRIVCPKGFEPDPLILEKANNINSFKKSIQISHDPFNAVNGANILYTDVWSSMGQEKDKDAKEKIFKDFSINEELMQKANDDVIVLHCLPAYRGKEITDEVMEGRNSRIFEQAENRMHAQQALLTCMLSK